MTGVLFRRLLLMALALLAATLFAVDYTLTQFGRRSRREPGARPHSGHLGRLIPARLSDRLLRFALAQPARSASQQLARKHSGWRRQDRPIEESRDEMGSLERSLGGVAIEVQKLLGQSTLRIRAPRDYSFRAWPKAFWPSIKTCV